MTTKKKSVKEYPVLVTGGAGFIGSHLVDAVMKNGREVSVLDNLSGGTRRNIKRWLDSSQFNFVQGDLLNQAQVATAVKGCKTIFHLAANPGVRLSSVDPSIHFEQNVKATYNLLEALRKTDTADLFVFMSSSTVYGDAIKIPTHEDYAPLKPISVYGGSKLASESLISAYAHTYGFNTVIYRLANIIGPRSDHGVIYDFIRKLKENHSELEILGDGTQAKSYLFVSDCIEAMLLGMEKRNSPVEVFNLGSDDWVDVKTIAQIVVQEMELGDVTFRFSGGVDGGRGWNGDVKYMLLDTNRLKSLGWRPKFNSIQSVRASARSILKDLS